MMDAQLWKRVRASFEELLELDGGARSRRMLELREQSAELAEAVQALLDRDTESDADPAPVSDVFGDVFGAATLAPGTRLGSYEIVDEIASGGMGTVYRARRADEQFEKSVAIKLIKRGMDSAEILARFRYERQVLADLEHPGIARLLDGGASADGQPYFVLEYVEGQPIDQWCDERRLGLRERLELFQKICQAVHYAHQHLVVHRDLKPNNILVTADGEPKLLDFGVAKMLDPQGEEDHGQWTQTQGFFGTPSYASPEQLRGERVTTATDVYSLGVVLYRILTGQRPHELSKHSREAGRKLVCEAEPTRPSKVVAEPGRERSPSSPAQLAGDLDNIVLMALRKEPERRYASAEQLAEDLQRHLDGLPVIARPNTLSYRASKFWRRNRASVVIGALLAASLVVGVVTSSKLYVEASAANEEAVERFEDVRRMAATFIHDVSGGIGPLEGTVQAREKIVRSALEHLDRLAGESKDDPAVMFELARAYLELGDLQGGGMTDNLGLRDEARASFDKATAMAQELVAESARETEYVILLAQCLYRHSDLDLLDGNSERAFERLHEALELCDSEFTGVTPRETRAVVLARLGDLHVRDGEADVALERYEEAVAIQEDLFSRDPDLLEFRRGLAVARNKLSEALFHSGNTDRAEDLSLLACAELESLLESEPENAETRQLFVSVHFWLGTLYLRSNRFTEAIAPLELADGHARLIVEADPRNELMRHNRTAGLQMLATALNRIGHHERALEVLREIRHATQQLLELDPTSSRVRRDLAVSSSTLAGVLIQLGRLDEAAEVNASARAEFEALRDAEPERAEPKRDLAACLANQGGFHMGVGKDEERSRAERGEHATLAKQSFQGALDELRELESSGRLNQVDQPLLGMLERFVGDAVELETELGVTDAVEVE